MEFLAERKAFGGARKIRVGIPWRRRGLRRGRRLSPKWQAVNHPKLVAMTPGAWVVKIQTKRRVCPPEPKPLQGLHPSISSRRQEQGAAK